MARHWIGTSGWSFANWKPGFYPKGVKQSDWLAHYARYLGSVELNASFYRPPQEKMLRGWVAKTPDDFLFAIKAWRMITHQKRLKDCSDQVANFIDRLAPLKEQTGPILFQCPPNLKRDDGLLRDFLATLPDDRPFAFEFRDPSWHDDDVYAILRDHGAAFVPFELAKDQAPAVVTADFVYVRLHGRDGKYKGDYGGKAMESWATWFERQLGEGRDVYCYFDNTDEADHAVRNAIMLDARLRRAAG